MDSLGSIYKKAILVYIILPRSEDSEEDIREFTSLAYSSNIKIISTIFSRSRTIHPKYFISTGKLFELNSIIKQNSELVVLFSCVLSSSQERNLIYFLKCKIIDRNQLILNIFAQRARTHEGKLQVDLAYLRYLNSRLVHEWSHLERQTGGIGVRGGPGETQLESDRRLLSKKILHTIMNLKKIKNKRVQNRNRRIKIGIPSISLVGYTNAGKSTLFNVLTLSDVHTSDKMFVTLDPTFRYIANANKSQIMLIDTVGFIKNLPNDLINSFKATLEETRQSRLLLHVVDTSNKKFEQNIDTVNHILNNINIHNVPTLMIMNKIDQTNKIDPHIDRDCNGLPIRVWVAAKRNLGIDLLKVAIHELLPKTMVRYELRIPIDSSSLCQSLYQLQAIEEYYIENKNTVKLKICLSSISWDRLLKRHELLSNYVI